MKWRNASFWGRSDSGDKHQTKKQSIWKDSLGGISLVPLAVLIVAYWDMQQTPWATLTALDESWLDQGAIWGVIFFQFMLQLPLLPVLLVGAAIVHSIPEATSWKRAAGIIPICILASGYLYWVLIQWERFAGYPPFMAAFVGFTVLWSINYWPFTSSLSRIIRLVSGGISIAGAFASLYIHAYYYSGYYQTLHMTLIGIGAVSLHGGLVAILGGKQLPPRVMQTVGIAGTWLAVILVVFSQTMGPSEAAERYGRTFATLLKEPVGKALFFTEDEVYRTQDCETLLTPVDVDLATRIFTTHSGLHNLPASFHLNDYNLVFVSIEAFRADAASPHSSGFSTPHLQTFHRDGAFYYTHARSPSTSTLQSVAAMFTLLTPYDAPIAFYRSNNWSGRLSKAVPTMAEIFSGAGYETFHWVHSGIARCCGSSLSRGFAKASAVGGDKVMMSDGQREVDVELIERTMQSIQEKRRRKQRFFAWLFLLSPHNPYEQRIKGTFTQRQRYDQDVAHVDKTLGRLLSYLKSSESLKDTIVVISGDHGEAFGDHNNHAHGNGVYAELARVPLYIWLPGTQGRRIDTPTSVQYVLPWLMLNGVKTAAPIKKMLSKSIAPLMNVTEGSVPVELKGAGGKLSAVSLTDRTHTAHYYFKSGLAEYYNHLSDPGEQHPLQVRSPPATFPMMKRLNRYLIYRHCQRASPQL